MSCRRRLVGRHGTGVDLAHHLAVSVWWPRFHAPRFGSSPEDRGGARHPQSLAPTKPKRRHRVDLDPTTYEALVGHSPSEHAVGYVFLGASVVETNRFVSKPEPCRQSRSEFARWATERL